MACQDYQQLLSAYIDEALSETEAGQLENHLDSCESCRQELGDLKDAILMLQSLDEVEPPAEFHQKLCRRLETEKQSQVRRPSLVNRLVRSPWLPLSAAAALVLIVVVSFGVTMLFRPMGSTQLADHAPAEYSQSGSAGDMDIAEDSARNAKLPPQGEGDDGNRQFGIASDEMAKSSMVENEQFERKVIQRAHFNVKVDDVTGAEQKLRNITDSLGGYIQSANISKDGNERYFASLTLRIPQSQFDAAVTQIKELGEVLNSSTSGDDVTQQYYDTEARLRIMREEEKSLLKLLEKADKMEDIMQVRRELSQVRQNIEVKESELKRLDQLTSLSTIDVSLQQVEVPGHQITATGMGGVWQRTITAFILSTNRLIKGLGNMIIGAGAILPLLLLLAALALMVFAVIRFRAKRKAE